MERDVWLFSRGQELQDEGLGDVVIQSRLFQEGQSLQPSITEKEIEEIMVYLHERERINLKKKAQRGNGKEPPRKAERTGVVEEESTKIEKEEWPETPVDSFHGIFGEACALIDPTTEADPVGVLVSLLAIFGNLAGNKPHFSVLFEQHPPRLFVSLVGRTAAARKGTATKAAVSFFSGVDPEWGKHRILRSISSGEALIYEVRDSDDDLLYEIDPKKREKLDRGVSDKRLFIRESEFGRLLRVMNRDGNTLSAIIRDAWDSGDLQNNSRANRLRSGGAHISLVGNITKDELLHELDDRAAVNGFANRFLWILVQKSKSLPDWNLLPNESTLAAAQDKFAQALSWIESITSFQAAELAPKADELWRSIYDKFDDDVEQGFLGGLIARGAPQVGRLALIYALADSSRVVLEEHLRAAIGIWEYSKESTRIIFGKMTGSRTQDVILEALEKGPLTRSQISAIFSGNQTKREIDKSLTMLLKGRQVSMTKEKGSFKKQREVWTLTTG